MRITFDTNTWQKVVLPERFPNDPRQHVMREVHRALVSGKVQGFICETVATLEAIPKGQRSPYLPQRAERGLVRVVSQKVVTDPMTGRLMTQMTIQVGGDSSAHPGLKPILIDRLQAAFALGLKLIPVARVGTSRPAEIDNEAYRIALTAAQREDVWHLLNRIGAVSEAIERRGVGFSVLEVLARRIQGRLGLNDSPWYNGIDRPLDSGEDREIDRAFAEWADGDTVAVHIGYELDAICTADEGKSAGHSIFDAENRQWLRDAYQVKIMNLEQLAETLRTT